MNTPKPHLEVILPIFNELQNIPVLMQRLDQVSRELRDRAKLSYLFINDGSTDGSKELLQELNQNRSDVRVINLLHNFGHNPAMACGLQHFDADAAILMDADLQDPPEVIPQLLDAWLSGTPTVVAERGSRQEKNQILFHSFYFLLHKIAPSLPPINYGTHCLMDKSVVARLNRLKEKNRYLPGLVGFSSGQIQKISVDRMDRNAGKSRVGFGGLINLAITALLSFSNAPVRIVSIFGLMASVGAITFGTVIIGIKLFTDKAIPGWASTMSVMAFGSGIQLLCLGIIGEYVARIYEEVKDRPLYLVDTILESEYRSRPLPFQESAKAASA